MKETINKLASLINQYYNLTFSIHLISINNNGLLVAADNCLIAIGGSDLHLIGSDDLIFALLTIGQVSGDLLLLNSLNQLFFVAL